MKMQHEFYVHLKLETQYVKHFISTKLYQFSKSMNSCMQLINKLINCRLQYEYISPVEVPYLACVVHGAGGQEVSTGVPATRPH